MNYTILRRIVFSLLFIQIFHAHGQLSVTGWGNNAYNQAFMTYPGADSLVDIKGGGSYVAVLDKSGYIATWGRMSNRWVKPRLFSFPVVKMSCGLTHMLTIRTDSTVVAYGDGNDYLQTVVPTGLKGVVEVAAGGYHSLALKTNGTVVAWGAGTTAGTAGFPHGGQSIVPTGLTGVIAIAAGATHSLALKSNGTVVAWGANSNGQCTIPSNLNGVVSIAAGKYFSMALKSNGTVVLWGSMDGFSPAAVPAGVSDIKAIAANEGTCMVLKGNNRKALCWGYQVNGLSDLPTLENVKRIALVGNARVAITNAGTVKVWMSNGIRIPQMEPVTVPQDMVAMSSGYYHNLVLHKDGTVTAFGAGKYSTTTYPQHGQAIVPAGLCDVVQVSAGKYHSVALKNDGSVVVWGAGTTVSSPTNYYDYGQCIIPAGLSSVKAVSAGGNHTLALKHDGTVVAWGYNGYSQCDVPAGLNGVVAIAAGVYHSVALKSDSTVVCWGAGRFEMQDPSQYWCNQSIVPPTLKRVVAIAAGGYHTVALTKDSAVVCWGAGSGLYEPHFGQCTKPQSLGKVTAIAAGEFHTMALKKDGTVADWGKMPNMYTPLISQGYQAGPADPPAGLGGVTSIVAGYNVGLAINGNTAPVPAPADFVTGRLYNDQNASCNYEALEINMGWHIVKAEPGPYYTLSNTTGNYSLKIPNQPSASTLTISALPYQSPAFKADPACPVGNGVTVDVDHSINIASAKDFGYKQPSCHAMEIEMASGTRGKCSSGTTAIRYRNRGNAVMANVYVVVEFPHFVRPVKCSRTRIALNDSVWRINLGVVGAGQSGYFTITDSVLCLTETPTDLDQCTKATIYPVSNCPVSPNWNGAQISVKGKCKGGKIHLGIYNSGSGNMQDSVEYKVYMDSIMVRKSWVTLAAFDSLKLEVEPAGTTVHLVVNQVQRHPAERFATATVQDCAVGSPGSSMSLVNHFPISQTPSRKTHCLPIRESYNPNEADVVPLGFTSEHVVDPGTPLEYLVRFQNTRTDTVYNVTVVDTLPEHLNPETFEMGTASHPVEVSMETVSFGRTLLKWRFNNLKLPASMANPTASRGFLQFRIVPKESLPTGATVSHEPRVIFEYNPPVATGMVLTTLSPVPFTDTSLNHHVQVITGINARAIPGSGIKLYPNPVENNRLTVELPAAGSLTIYNSNGREIFTRGKLEGIQVIPIFLKAGIYMARITTAQGTWTEKIVVPH